MLLQGQPKVYRENLLSVQQIAEKTLFMSLTRIMHEPPATTADMAVLPGVLGSWTLRVRAPVVARWHNHLHDLVTASRA